MMKQLLLVLILLITVNLYGQDASKLQQEKMKGLSALAGTWEGEGWMILPDTKKHEFIQKETVASKFGGNVLTIDGIGKDKTTGAGIHDALGFITFDVIKQQYRFTAMTGMGYITDAIPEVKANESLVWNLSYPGTMIKFTIKFSDTDWIETGEVSRDNGKTWFQNFEMRLKKAKS